MVGNIFVTPPPTRIVGELSSMVIPDIALPDPEVLLIINQTQNLKYWVHPTDNNFHYADEVLYGVALFYAECFRTWGFYLFNKNNVNNSLKKYHY